MKNLQEARDFCPEESAWNPLFPSPLDTITPLGAILPGIPGWCFILHKSLTFSSVTCEALYDRFYGRKMKKTGKSKLFFQQWIRSLSHLLTYRAGRNPLGCEENRGTRDSTSMHIPFRIHEQRLLIAFRREYLTYRLYEENPFLCQILKLHTVNPYQWKSL